MEGDLPGVRIGPPDAGERPAGALRRLLPLVRPYRRHLTAAIVVSIGGLVAQVLQPQIIKRFVDEVVHGGRHERLLPYALVALGLGVTYSVFAFVRRNASGAVSLGLEYDLRNRLYRHLQSLEADFHDGWQSGQLVQRAVSDISRIRRFLGFGLMWLVVLAATFLFVFAMLFREDVGLALLTLGFSAPVTVISYRFARRWHVLSKRAQDEQGDLTTIVEESAVGVRIVKALGRMPERSSLFGEGASTLLGTNLERVGLRANFWSIDQLLINLSLAVVLLVGALRVTGGGMSVGSLVAFVFYQLMLVWPVRDMGWIISMAQEAVAASERVLELLDTEPRIADRPGAIELPTTRGHLRFEGVGVRYPDAPAWVLRDFDLEVRPGETVALVGMTGSGKTTVSMLAPRFTDPVEGRVTLDGHDLRDVALDSLRSHLGVAFEDPILFSVSVRENVLMGAPGVSDTDVWEALRAARAEGFVRELPWGLDTRVGEQGYALSGGQRQRIALARAIIGRPAILVLDNPLSSVDVHTEAEIEAALAEVLVDRTTLLVAHRPSTLLLADRVALVADGCVVATGTHHELLETVPRYREVLAQDTEGPAFAQEVKR